MSSTKISVESQLAPAVRSSRLAAIRTYSIAIILTFVFLGWVVQIWKADLEVPFWGVHLDGSSMLMSIKTMIDTGWYLHNPYVGAPGGLSFEDFPTPDNLNWLLLRILAFFSSNPAAVVNLFFLLGFALTTATSLYVFRRFRVASSAAIPASILYALLPAHFLRGETHIFLGAYYIVPLAALVALWVCSGEELFLPGQRPWRLKWRLPDGPRSVVICVLLGASGVYYAAFGCFLFLLAALISFGRQRSLGRVLVPLLLIAITAGSLVINALPSEIYVLRNGPNPEAVGRSAGEGEVYALRITQLVLPITGHRVPFLAALKASYSAVLGGLVNENDFASLGAVGTSGFLLLTLGLFWRYKGQRTLFQDLALLSAGCVLLGTASGFGPLAGFLAFRYIRAYNRISVVIAFFSLFAVALAAEEIKKVCWRRPWSQTLYYSAIFAALLMGVADQTSASYTPDYSSARNEFRQDEAFISQIERLEPPGSMIFQLPYVPFPEFPPVYHMDDYDLFKGYVHSHALRWSYGAMKGRPGDLWQRHLLEAPQERLAENLALAGFSGIFIDRNGYPDGAAQLQAQFQATIRSSPLVSAGRRLLFFDLQKYRSELRGSMSPEEWARRRDAILHPLLTRWGGEFSGLEGDAAQNWRWCGSKGSLSIQNYAAAPKAVRVEMTIRLGSPDASELRIKGQAIDDTLHIGPAGSFYSKTLQVRPGGLVVHFACNGKPLLAPGDPRSLVFRIDNFKLTQQ
jgi:phosphoglycerol transferase